MAKKELIMVCTRDKYETPLGVFDTAAQAARFAGLHRSSLAAGHTTDPGSHKSVKFVRVIVEDDDDV